LDALAATLTQLGGSLATNSALTSAQQQAVQSTLGSMQGVLVAMSGNIGTTIAGSESAAPPVAATQPSGAPLTVNISQPVIAAPSVSVPASTTTPAMAPSAPAAVNQPTPSANTVPQTAQASSFWSFTKAHWPTIVIVLLVIGILAILFWPEKKTVNVAVSGTSEPGKPKVAPAPNVAATSSHHTIASDSQKPQANSSTPAPATPVASAVAAPSQK
jgi:hypothetical protein